MNLQTARHLTRIENTINERDRVICEFKLTQKLYVSLTSQYDRGGKRSSTKLIENANVFVKSYVNIKTTNGSTVKKIKTT